MNEEQLSDLLYSIGMESQEAWHHMRLLCALLDVEYPPKKMEKK